MEYYCCEECIDIAIDEVVDTVGMPPELEFVQQEKGFSTSCSFCKNEAKYVVRG